MRSGFGERESETCIDSISRDIDRGVILNV